MSIWIAFFRGINVSGNHTLPMKDIVGLFEKNGCTDVKTYIQSGNVIFRSSETNPSNLADRLRGAILKSHGFQPQILVLSVEELKKAVLANPFPNAEVDPKTVHLLFLAETPGNPDINALNKAKLDNEAFILKDRIFYVHTPNGLGRSKLATKAEKLIGVHATARNWRTVSKILEMTQHFE